MYAVVKQSLLVLLLCIFCIFFKIVCVFLNNYPLIMVNGWKREVF